MKKIIRTNLFQDEALIEIDNLLIEIVNGFKYENIISELKKEINPPDSISIKYFNNRKKEEKVNFLMTDLAIEISSESEESLMIFEIILESKLKENGNLLSSHLTKHEKDP